MSLKLQIDSAKNAVSQALIAALENKDESAVSNLITCYNTLSNTHVKHSFAIGGTSGIHVNTYDNINIPCSMNDDVISFGAVGRP